MNAPTTILVPLTIDDAHRLRSRLLDAFAGAEQIVSAIAAQSSAKPSDGACLGQRIEAAKKIKPGPQLSAEKHKQLLASLAELVVLLPVRNDIVHARLRLASVDDQPTLLFRNERTQGAYPLVRMITGPQLEQLVRAVAATTGRLRAALTPPSPPQPKPAATTDP